MGSARGRIREVRLVSATRTCAAPMRHDAWRSRQAALRRGRGHAAVGGWGGGGCGVEVGEGRVGDVAVVLLRGGVR